jgi:hypothetical protein
LFKDSQKNTIKPIVNDDTAAGGQEAVSAIGAIESSICPSVPEIAATCALSAERPVGEDQNALALLINTFVNFWETMKKMTIGIFA